MNSPIHQTDAEKLQQATAKSHIAAISETTKRVEEVTKAVQKLEQTASDKSTEREGFNNVVISLRNNTQALDTLKDYIDHPEVVVRKVEEVKSALLITNKLLKDITNKKEKEYPTSMKMEITNKPNDAALAFFSMLKGDKGDSRTDEELIAMIKPLIPPLVKGDKGEAPTAEELLALIKPLIPKVKDGAAPTKEQLIALIKPLIPTVKDGKDGSPDTPDEVVEKVNISSKRINPERVKGLREVMREVENYGRNPQGQIENVGGANPLILLSGGIRISDFVTELNFSTNITAVYNGNGRITLTASGGTTTFTETPTGAVDGANKSYTTAHTITTVINLVINGQFIHPAEYTVSGAGFTMVTALDATLSGTGFTIIYQ